VPGVVVAGQDKLGNEIRKFNDSAIQSQIDRAVAALSPGAKGAVIAVGTKDEQQLAVVAKMGKGFSVVGTLSHAGTKNWKTWNPSIAIRKEW
jgi:hypothetical protein